MAAKKIRVTSETSTGLNKTFHVPGQGHTSRSALVRQVEAGKHPGYHTRTTPGGTKFVASNPDGSKRNNLG